MVAQNRNGCVVGGINRKLRSDNIDTLEALAIYDRLRLATENGWSKIEIESDSHVVIQHRERRMTQWRFQAICLNIKSLDNQVDQVQWKSIS